MGHAHQDWHSFWRVVYYEPMFKARCRKVGKNFRLEYAGNGICRVLGNLQLYIGDNVVTFDNISLSAARVYDEPRLTIGSGTYLGPRCRIHAAREVTLGNQVIIGSGIMITDNAGHPSNASARMVPGGGVPTEDDVRPVVIGDYCFFGDGCYVYPGAAVGDGVLARAGAHIMGIVPPFSVIGGNPGKVSRLLAIPGAMRQLAGEERYQAWVKARDAFMAENPHVKQDHEPC